MNRFNPLSWCQPGLVGEARVPQSLRKEDTAKKRSPTLRAAYLALATGQWTRREEFGQEDGDTN